MQGIANFRRRGFPRRIPHHHGGAAMRGTAQHKTKHRSRRKARGSRPYRYAAAQRRRGGNSGREIDIIGTVLAGTATPALEASEDSSLLHDELTAIEAIALPPLELRLQKR